LGTGKAQALSYEYLWTAEIIEQLEGLIKEAQSLASQLEKLRSMRTSIGFESEAYVDLERYLINRIGQLAEKANSFRDAAKKRISSLSPKASLLRHRLEYLEARMAIGMVEEKVYLEARDELMGQVGEVEDSLMQLVKLVDMLEKVMIKFDSLLKAPTESKMSEKLEKAGREPKRDIVTTE
jgi:hypothetical protein